MASEPIFRVNGNDYPVPDDLTLGEMADMERYFGVNFQKPEISSMSTLAGLLYIAIRRVDDTVTVDDIRALPADAFEQVGDARPPAGTPASGPPASVAPTNESSNDGSDDSETAPNDSGDPTSERSTTSDLATSRS